MSKNCEDNCHKLLAENPKGAQKILLLSSIESNITNAPIYFLFEKFLRFG